jgi:hypothetical protein
LERAGGLWLGKEGEGGREGGRERGDHKFTEMRVLLQILSAALSHRSGLCTAHPVLRIVVQTVGISKSVSRAMITFSNIESQNTLTTTVCN